MAEVIFTILLFGAITFITAVLFGGWVVFTVFRVIFRVISSLFGATTHYSRQYARTARAFRMPVGHTRTCLNPRCLQTNPADARYCKRCGRSFPQGQHVAVRRAAMW